MYRKEWRVAMNSKNRGKTGNYTGKNKSTSQGPNTNKNKNKLRRLIQIYKKRRKRSTFRKNENNA